jgi:hypothetical protein
VGGESARRAAADRVEEHPDGEREHALGNPEPARVRARWRSRRNCSFRFEKCPADAALLSLDPPFSLAAPW